MADKLVEDLSVILLLARDTEATAAFYRDALDVSLQPEEHDGRQRHFACRLGSVYFTIQSAAELVRQEPGRSYDFLQMGFTVSDLDAFLERLEGLGIKPLHEPRQFEHTRYTTLVDPDGRHVRVMTPWGR